MATSLLALFDDISSLMDDVAILTKIAAKKTSGVVADDLALNTHQLTGASPERELIVVAKVARGALINKAILVPVALVISALLPSIVIWLLMIGGLFLCFEGVEKLYEKIFHKTIIEAGEASEEEKIKGAIKTDFVLSAEIIVIALGAVAGKPLIGQVISISLIALLMTAGVYGFVALLVKLDDIGLHLAEKKNIVVKNMGLGLVYCMPYLMKLIGIVGTIAMFLVGGGIISHGIHMFSEGIESVASLAPAMLQNPIAYTLEASLGVVLGVVVLLIVKMFKKLKRKV